LNMGEFNDRGVAVLGEELILAGPRGRGDVVGESCVNEQLAEGAGA